jgi:hypothetical protein
VRNDATPTLADDLLLGARPIAKFIFGSDGPAEVRRTYHLAATGNLPVFEMGALLAARKSKLLRLGAEAA